jgi:hypothetical protein
MVIGGEGAAQRTVLKAPVALQLMSLSVPYLPICKTFRLNRFIGFEIRKGIRISQIKRIGRPVNSC